MDDFIEGRKKFRLREANLLRRGEEKRHSFVFECVLTEGDDTTNGMPEFVLTAYNTMLKACNLQKRTQLDACFENVAIDIFPTPKGRRAFTTIIGSTLAKFGMERVGKGDNADVVLTFTAIFPGRKEIHDWTYEHKKHDFFAEFEPQQGEIFAEAQPNGTGEDVEDEIEDEEAEDEE